MKFLSVLLCSVLCYLPTAWANVDLNIKYSSNYLMPAYVHFKADGAQYAVDAKINVPLYNIQFLSTGTQDAKQFNMVDYQDIRGMASLMPHQKFKPIALNMAKSKMV